MSDDQFLELLRYVAPTESALKATRDVAELLKQRAAKPQGHIDTVIVRPEEWEQMRDLEASFRRDEASWPITNRRRGTLIEKDITGTLSPSERSELDGLQAYASDHVHKVAPRPTHVLDELALEALRPVAKLVAKWDDLSCSEYGEWVWGVGQYARSPTRVPESTATEIAILDGKVRLGWKTLEE